jgi:hypothetical protein
MAGGPPGVLHLLPASKAPFVFLHQLPSVRCHHWLVQLHLPCLADSATAAAAAGAPCAYYALCAAAAGGGGGAAAVGCWCGVLCT